ncbi:sugar ABC transporter substrate-binding protein [Prescottella agglutinans]|uniref:Ribose transport system substrate-binding protein n=1 Tax=Prescottella agglutinans TaxID=1644129 RepID=A0ABT6M6B3_9NOCA|nr:sugar ABC transporter substrate-binding protein [Prescottella agglutinans]MDH6279852.1 ribose transport system substrate-binding protein [Prescottella agglutinans]
MTRTTTRGSVRGRLSKVGLGVLGMITASLVVVGCAGATGDSASASGTDPAGSAWLAAAENAAQAATTVPTVIRAAELGPVTPPATRTIFFVGCDQSIPGCVAQVTGVQEAAAALKYTVKVCDAKADVASFQNCMSQAVNAKPDVIVNNARPAADAAEAYAAAHAAGIPVIGQFTSEQPDPAKGNTVEVGNVCHQEGEMLGNFIVAESGGKADVAVFADTVYGCNGQRAEGIETALDRCASCKSTIKRFSAATAQTDLPPALQATIQSNPKLNWIVGTPGFSGLMASDAVRQAGKADSISVGTFDGDEPGLALARKGDIIKADVASGVYENGWTVVDAAVRLAAGQTIPNGISNPTQLLMTQSSVPQSGTYEGATGFRDQFKQLWGVA